ncbi:hypothetical protein CYMTET_44348 [Cymbomonas tetramitiformis]|uniref:glucan endo-1,3-beta-D-glucosidase n=1 Tax=Cymbomonas tetramitiformis TaxID=36881 RepID=A0AAE0EZQ2_9CHLO|nr:hypothetical protein CYMTET_44348 [Cymbomonas tetramitiformis]
MLADDYNSETDWRVTPTHSFMSKVAVEAAESYETDEVGMGYVSSVPYHVRVLENVDGKHPEYPRPDAKSMDPIYLDGHNESVHAEWNVGNFTGWCFGYIRAAKDELFNYETSELELNESVRYARGTDEGVDFQSVFSEYPARMHDMCVRFNSTVTVKSANNITDSGSDLHGQVVFSNGAVLHLTRGSPVITMELPAGEEATVTPLFYDLALAPPSHYEAGRSALVESACDTLRDNEEPYAEDVVMWSDTNTSYYKDSRGTSYQYGYLMQHFSSTHDIRCKPSYEEYEESEGHSTFSNVSDTTCVVKTNSGLAGSMQKACCNCCPAQCYATVTAEPDAPALLRFAFYTNPSSVQTLLNYSEYYVAGAEVLIEEETNHLVYEYKTKPTSDPTQPAVVDETRRVLLGAMHHHVAAWAHGEFPEMSVYNHNRSFQCYDDPAQPRICKDIMRHVGDASYVRGAHDGRLHYTDMTVWHMDAIDPEVPSPNSTLDALSASQRDEICQIFAKEEHEFQSDDTHLYYLGKYTYRMARVLRIAEHFECGSDTNRTSLRERLHYGLMRFLDGKYPYYKQNGASVDGEDVCYDSGQCAGLCDHGCVHKNGLRYDDNGWGGMIMDGNYGYQDNTTENDCERAYNETKESTWCTPIADDRQNDYGHKHYNDHHYHFGYMIASIALYADGHPDFLDEAPLSPSCPNGTGDSCPTVKQKTLTLVKEIANHDHTDPYFPQARHKDMYDWASWAGAIEVFNDDLRDQEATVEGYVGYYGAELLAKLLGDNELILWTRLLRGTDQRGWNSYRWFLPEVGYAPEERFGGVTSYSEIGLVAKVTELKWSSALYWSCDPNCYPQRFACWIAINVLPLIPGVTEQYYSPEWAEHIKHSLGDPALEAQDCGDENTIQVLHQVWRNYVHAFNALTKSDTHLHRQRFTNETLSSNNTYLDNGMSRMDTLVWFFTIENSSD